MCIPYVLLMSWVALVQYSWCIVQISRGYPRVVTHICKNVVVVVLGGTRCCSVQVSTCAVLLSAGVDDR